MRLRTLTYMLPLLAALAAAGCKGDADKLADKEKELEELRQLAEIDKREMENQYAEFAAQYGEMKLAVKDDSLVARIEAEQQRAEQLLAELRQVKSNSSAEILRLKKELATVRAVLREYIRQVDSLQQINQTLSSELDQARAETARTREENNSIQHEKAALSEKVAIAAQLNTTGVHIVPLKKNGKEARRPKDIVRFAVSFTVSRNVTAQTGMRTAYVRLLKPGQQVCAPSGSFTYENRQIEYSAARKIEYNGQEQSVTIYVPVNEFIEKGAYSAYIFIDGQMTGSGTAQIGK